MFIFIVKDVDRENLLSREDVIFVATDEKEAKKRIVATVLGLFKEKPNHEWVRLPNKFALYSICEETCTDGSSMVNPIASKLCTIYDIYKDYAEEETKNEKWSLLMFNKDKKEESKEEENK